MGEWEGRDLLTSLALKQTQSSQGETQSVEMKELLRCAAFWVVFLSPIVFNHGPATLRFDCRNKIDLRNAQ